ncbi:MAG: hypothetical protein IMY85_06160 [Chloroflexi bacterium]|nr:hypothetical protein [Chloroflexota bacterium]
MSFPFSFLPFESHSQSFHEDPSFFSTQKLLPVTGGEFASLISVIHLPPPATDLWTSRGQLPSLNKFVARVENGQNNTVRGVYIPGFFALPVVQQPGGNTGFVSGKPETVTQFQLAARYNVLGFLAHNYLSGKEFFRLIEGLQVVVVKGDGSFDRYRISAIDEYQKVTPGSNWSHYIDLETGERLTTYQVFGQYYQGANHLTFQTCLAKDGIETWGLRFIVAEPIV